MACILWLWTNVYCMTYSHHYGIKQSVFPALKIPCVLPIHPSLSQPMGTDDFFFFAISIVLPFPEHHMVKSSVAISDWFLSLISNRHL